MARSYDFFMHYFTLLVTPMNLLCGVFFPVEQLPAAFQAIAAFLPLTHAVAIARPLLLGQIPPDAVLHALVLLAYAAAGFYAATVLFRRRLLEIRCSGSSRLPPFSWGPVLRGGSSF